MSAIDWTRPAEAPQLSTAVDSSHSTDGAELHAADAATENAEQGKSEQPEDAGRKSVATMLVELATEVYSVAPAEDGSVFAVPRTGPRVVYPLRGGRSSLRAALAGLYFTRTGRAASQQALADALAILEGQAQQQEPATLHLRVAEADESWWIDVGDHTGRAVQVSPAGWQVVETPPVLFRRTALTSPLPIPVAGSTVDELWELLNVRAEDRPLLLAWLVAAIIPGISHPILGLFGEQGAGKTTAGKILAGLLDPSPVPVRKAPRDADSWMTAASGSWIVALDNLSTIAGWLSDTLCRAVTGDGDVRRQLYTDGDLVVYSFRRAIIVTSIDIGAANGDFGDRLLPIDLDPIDEAHRLTDRSLWPRWEQAHPRILGGLLDLAAGVAGVLPFVELATHTRMADFMEVLAAVDQLTGSTGLHAYRGKVGSLAADTLTADPFITALSEKLDAGDTWEGTAAELLALVTPAEERWRAPKGWPASARHVTTLLRRQAPVMRKAGWEADDLGSDNHDKAVHWRLTRREKARNGPPQHPRDPHQPSAAGHAGNAGQESLPSPSTIPRGDELRPVPEGDPHPAYTCQRCPVPVETPSGMCPACARAARRKAQAELTAGGGPDAA